MSCEPKKAIWSSVGRIANVTTASMQHFTVNLRRFAKHNVASSLDHAICGGKTSVDQAARFSSSLTCYVGLFASRMPLRSRTLQSPIPCSTISFRNCGSIETDDFKLMNG
jgi:hypothetical protein